MRPVNQQAADECFRACLASVLELPLSAVPHMVHQSDWPGCLNTWLARSGIGLRIVGVSDGADILDFLSDMTCIVSGDGPRGQKHAVLMRGRETLHDPYAEFGAISLKGAAVWLLVPTNPERAEGVDKLRALVGP